MLQYRCPILRTLAGVVDCGAEGERGLDRFVVASVQQRMRLPQSLEELREQLQRFLRAAQAKNARLRVFSAEDAAKGDIQMTLHGQAWRMRHCYLKRGYVSDIRYTLETADESIHAQADVLGQSAGQRLPRIVMTQPDDIEVGTSAGWFTKNFPVTRTSTGQPLGCIRERSAITFKRELVIDVPGMEPAVAAFLGIVALIVRY